MGRAALAVALVATACGDPAPTYARTPVVLLRDACTEPPGAFAPALAAQITSACRIGGAEFVRATTGGELVVVVVETNDAAERIGATTHRVFEWAERGAYPTHLAPASPDDARALLVGAVLREAGSPNVAYEPDALERLAVGSGGTGVDVAALPVFLGDTHVSAVRFEREDRLDTSEAWSFLVERIEASLEGAEIHVTRTVVGSGSGTGRGRPWGDDPLGGLDGL